VSQSLSRKTVRDVTSDDVREFLGLFLKFPAQHISKLRVEKNVQEVAGKSVCFGAVLCEYDPYVEWEDRRWWNRIPFWLEGERLFLRIITIDPRNPPARRPCWTISGAAPSDVFEEESPEAGTGQDGRGDATNETVARRVNELSRRYAKLIRARDDAKPGSERHRELEAELKELGDELESLRERVSP